MLPNQVNLPLSSTCTSTSAPPVGSVDVCVLVNSTTTKEFGQSEPCVELITEVPVIY